MYYIRFPDAFLEIIRRLADSAKIFILLCVVCTSCACSPSCYKLLVAFATHLRCNLLMLAHNSGLISQLCSFTCSPFCSPSNRAWKFLVGMVLVIIPNRVLYALEKMISEVTLYFCRWWRHWGRGLSFTDCKVKGLLSSAFDASRIVLVFYYCLCLCFLCSSSFVALHISFPIWMIIVICLIDVWPIIFVLRRIYSFSFFRGRVLILFLRVYFCYHAVKSAHFSCRVSSLNKRTSVWLFQNFWCFPQLLFPLLSIRTFCSNSIVLVIFAPHTW